MADVCRAHYLSLQTAHLMIIMQCMIHREQFFLMYFLCLKAKCVLFPMSDRNRLSLLTLVEPCRDRDCKIMFYMMSRKTNLTKQNKELPSIPLLTYYNFSYPVTQRQALIISTQLHYQYCNYVFIMGSCNTNPRCFIHYPEPPLRGLHKTFPLTISMLNTSRSISSLLFYFYSLVCFAHTLTIFYLPPPSTK